MNWESWEDVDTSDPEEIIEWFEETIQDCEDGNWEACEQLEELEEVFEELIDECLEERNAEACETLEELEEIFEDLEDDFESEGDDGGGPYNGSPEEILLSSLKNWTKSVKMAINELATPSKKFWTTSTKTVKTIVEDLLAFARRVD